MKLFMFISFAIVLFTGCIEEFNPELNEFTDLLVIDNNHAFKTSI